MTTTISFLKLILQITTFGCLLLLGACFPKFNSLPETTDIELPEKWNEAEQTSPEPQVDTPPKEGKTIKNGWLKTFADDDLNRYVNVALDNNPDLIDSAAQLKSAIEQVNITGSNLWPSILFNTQSNRTEVSGAGLSGRNALSNSTGVTTEVRTVRSTLDISWEADVWGKLTQRKKAAAYSAKAQGELFKSAELSLVANVSRAWYNLITNKLQLELAHQRLDSFKSTATLIEENYQRGIRSALDVYLSRTDVQQEISNLSESRFDYIQSLRAFKTLLGEYPDTDLEFNATLPELTSTVPVGLPAQLLTRRPDIKAGQLNYQAQIANAKAAHRDLFPSISFNGSIGDSRDTFNQLFDDDNMIMTLVSNLTLPIFASGSLRSLRDQAVFSAESAYASLLRTTLGAFEEVENTLSRETVLLEQRVAIEEAVKLAENGLELALERYQSGIENYNTVLESQRRLFESKRNQINIRNALLQNRIGIHLALGGDFSDIENRDPLSELPSAKGKKKAK